MSRSRGPASLPPSGMKWGFPARVPSCLGCGFVCLGVGFFFKDAVLFFRKGTHIAQVGLKHTMLKDDFELLLLPPS